ncbi:MAG: hypothetical protein V3V08_10230 [Nannocystaceae bacterium]
MIPLISRIEARLPPHPRLRLSLPRPFCLVIQPAQATTRDFLDEALLAPAHRSVFFSLVDEIGLVVVRGFHSHASCYRQVRGRSSRGRLSQGEYYHHDGCSGPTNPRIVEIRCPYQAVARHIATAIAPFPDTVYAMLYQLPSSLAEDSTLARWRQELEKEGELPSAALHKVQGLILRAVRRGLTASTARTYLRKVDRRCHAYDEPWRMGESRFIANENRRRTLQHRRCCEPSSSVDAHNPQPLANGRLLKRWPAGELDDITTTGDRASPPASASPAASSAAVVADLSDRYKV